eukprot:TRINITY_DN2904_c0_g1_i1.p1 TRINITY_DN2904_c0_g1~~TRINITY_DN2904_c0_g1_i1.p1  ORF type:complete len:179 (-),score=13.05 TRINITY_DN2904_c0_g1_i1:680-1216(-)
MVQRPRWADLVDSSDDEMISDNVSGGVTGLELVLELQAAPTTTPHGSGTRPVSRRTDRSSNFTERPPATPTAKPSRNAYGALENMRKPFAVRRGRQDELLAPRFEEGRGRRIAKRTTAIQLVKSMPEYMEVKRNCCGRPCCGCTPETPDPADYTMSKRHWEARVAIWRSAVRQRCRTS